MKRLLSLAVVACWLSPAMDSASSMAHGQDDVLIANDLTAEPFVQGGVDVWGRINPEFCGFPTVSMSADLVILGRSTPDAQTILLDGAAITPLLDASDFGTPSRAGARLNLTFFDHWDWDFMFDMLFMGDMTSRQSVDPSNGVTLFFYQGVAADPVDTASFRSDLDTGEFNVRRRLGSHLALLGGVRYLELNESLDFNQGGASGGYTSQSDNRLIGGQLGGEGVLPLWGYGRLFATGKYGVYNNRFMVAAQATSGGAPISISVRDDMPSYVGELNAGWEIHTVPCMTLRLGYQALWLRDMALSTDQLNQYSIFNSVGSVRKGNASFHGGFVGLAFTF